MRLDKYLADCGIGTRSEIKKLIRAGLVRVEGEKRIVPELKINEKTAEVYVNEASVKYRKYVYLMLNKPKDYLSATWDKNKKVVLDLVPEEYLHYEPFPVGRLDIDTVGLMILTNDGELAHRLLSPTRHVPKTYFAKVDRPLLQSDVEAFSREMDLGDFIAKPAILKITDAMQGEAEVTIEEGKFHQIKRMFEKVGKTVVYLKRISMNKLMLDTELSEGEIRELTDDELELLTYGTK